MLGTRNRLINLKRVCFRSVLFFVDKKRKQDYNINIDRKREIRK